MSNYKKNLSTEVSDKDKDNTIKDKSGVIYSKNGKRLLGCKNESLTQYAIRKGTEVICDNAFEKCKNLKNIHISDSVLAIGKQAFRNCEWLAEITIPSNVITIGDNVFPYEISVVNFNATACKSIGALSLAIHTTVNIGDNVTVIPDKMFSNAELTQIIIPESVTTIGEEAFYYCKNLNEITIPNNVTLIGDEAFSGCENLNRITIPDNVIKIGKELFKGCKNLIEIILPNGVTTIGDEAFSGCGKLKWLDIPDSVVEIGNEAFTDCKNLTEITIPENVTTIGQDEFRGCCNLKQVNFNAKACESIQASDYYGYFEEDDYDCYDLTVNFGDKVTFIPGYLFEHCDLKQVTLGRNVTEIRAWAFGRNYNLKLISYNPTPPIIRWNAFFRDKYDYDCIISDPYYYDIFVPKEAKEAYSKADGWKEFIDIEEITEEDTGESIKTADDSSVVTERDKINAFEDGNGILYSKDGTRILKCKNYAITRLSIPNNVTTICDSAFEWCTKLSKVVIPDSVTIIGDGSFRGCETLTEIHIPCGVKKIGAEAFALCKRLTKFEVANSNEHFSAEEGVLFSKNKDTLVKLPLASTATSYNVPIGVTKIGDKAFEGCEKLTKVFIPNSVVEIGKEAFDWSGNLQEFKVDKDNKCFSSQEGVLFSKGKDTLIRFPIVYPRSSSYNVPATVTLIRNMAFANCKNLTEINVPDNVIEIGKNSFYGCVSLMKVTIGNGVSRIREGVFSECLSLKELTIGNNITKIDRNAFNGSHLDCLISLNPIPPNARSLGGPDVIFVPVGAKDAYYNDNFRYNEWRWCHIEEIESITGQSGWDIDCERTREDMNDAIKDENGVLYSKDGKRLISFGKAGGEYAIKDGTLIICNRALYDSYNKSITSIIIPSSVMAIGYNAFEPSDYPRSDSIFTQFKVSKYNRYFRAEEGVLFSKDMTKLLSFPQASPITSYRIPNGVTTIECGAFRSCTKLTEVIIPQSVTTIGNGAFSSCTELKEIIIPDSVTTIGSGAFHSCTKLTEIIIPHSVTTIGKRAFYGCKTLTKVNIGNGVREIEEKVFAECTDLKEIIIGKNVSIINEYAFVDVNEYGAPNRYTRTNKFVLLNPTPPELFYNYEKWLPAILYVTSGAKETYSTSYGWKGVEKIIEMADSEKTLSEVIITDVNQKIYAPFSIYINEKEFPVDLSIGSIYSNIDRLISLTKLHKLSVSDAVYDELRAKNGGNMKMIDSINRLQLEENINTVLSPNKVKKIKNYLSDIGALVTNDFDFAFKGELCVISFTLNDKDMSVLVNIKGDIITDPCSKVILLSTKRALCTTYSDKILRLPRYEDFRYSVIDKQFIVSSDGKSTLVDWGDVDFVSMQKNLIILKKNRFNQLEKEQIEYYLNAFIRDSVSVDIPKCPYCDKDLIVNEETGPYACQSCERIILGDEVDDFINYLPIQSRLHIFSAMNFSEAFKTKDARNGDFIISCDKGYNEDFNDEISTITNQKLYSIYSIEENKLLFPFLPYTVIIEDGEIYIQTEIDKKTHNKGHHYSKDSSNKHYYGYKYDGEVAEHIDYTFIGGPCVGMTLLDAFKNNFKELREYANPRSMHICTSAINELVALFGMSDKIRNLIAANDELFSFEKICSLDDELRGCVRYHSVGHNGIGIRALRPFYQGFSFYKVFSSDPEYVLNTKCIYAITDDVVDGVKGLNGYLKLVKAIKKIKQDEEKRRKEELKQKQERQRELDEWEPIEIDYEEQTFYALGGWDYEEFKRNGGDLDEMMEGMGF